MKDFIEFLIRMSAKFAHKGEHVMHVVYLCMVGYQADHAYKYAAMGVVVFIFISTIAGDGD